MNIYSISDLHLSVNNPKPMDIFGPVWDNYVEDIFRNWDDKIKDDDITLIAGDISWAMELKDAIPDLKLIAMLKGKKIILRGNHDYWWKSISALRKNLPDSILALQNDCIRVGNYLFCGTRGWATPETSCFASAADEKIYNREIVRLRLSLSAMDVMRKPDDIVVGMSHYPPFNVRLESSAFTRLFREFGVNKIVYGHLHGNSARTQRIVHLDNAEYFLTSCDSLSNDPLKII